MTVKTFPPMILPEGLVVASSGVYSALAAISANGDKFAAVYQAQSAMSVKKIWISTGTVTTGGTIDVRIETLDANGDPSGTLWSTTTNGSYTLLATDDNIYVVATLTSTATITEGAYFAVVVANTASPANFQVRGYSRTSNAQFSFPYGDRSVAGVWTKSSTVPPFTCVNASDTPYPLSPDYVPSTTAANDVTNMNTGTNPSKMGNSFFTKIPWRVTGVVARITANTTATFNLVLLEGSAHTTVLSLTVDPAKKSSSGNVMVMKFASTYILKPGLQYIVAVDPTSVTNVGLDELITQGGLGIAPFGVEATPGRGEWLASFYQGSWPTYSSVSDLSGTGLAEIGIVVDAVDYGTTPQVFE